MSLIFNRVAYIWKGVVVVNELICSSYYFGRVWSVLERTDL